MVEIAQLIAAIKNFADARDWAQFHTPRNLILALAGEVGELAAELQWIPDTEVEQAMKEPGKRQAIESEIADITIYVLRLADVLGMNVHDAVTLKLALNEERYPAEQARGSARKYTEFGQP